jgi:hypothetical protein
LWLGGTANRNRDAFEERFSALVAAVEKELQVPSVVSAKEQVATVTGD